MKRRRGKITTLVLLGLLVLTTAIQSRADNSFEDLSRLSDQFELLSSEIGPSVVQIYSYGITPAVGISRSAVCCPSFAMITESWLQPDRSRRHTILAPFYRAM